MNFKIIASKSGRSIHLSANGTHNYIFGCFQGFQRYCTQRKIKLKNFTNFFITKKSDLISVSSNYLTHSEAELEDLNVILNNKMIENEENFVQNLFCKNRQCNILNSFEDEKIKVLNLYLDGYTNYLIEFKPIKGSFLVNKLDKNFPRDQIKKLKNGEKVTFDGKIFDGNDYKKDDIYPEPVYILNSLPKNLNEMPFFDQIEVSSLIFCNNDKILKKIKKINKDSFSIKNKQGIDFESIFLLSKMLRSISPNFQVPINRKCRILKKSELSDGCEMTFDKQKKVYNLYRKESLESTEDIIKNKMEKYNITFLGTGSGVPSKYRNVSSNLINFNKIKILVDTGEDTMNQIKRIDYNYKKTIENLEFILITHHHEDHFFGVVEILNAKFKSKSKNIVIFAPQKVISFINFFIEEEKLKKFATIINISLNLFDKKIYDFGNKTLEIEHCGVIHCKDSVGYAISLFKKDKNL